MSTKIVADSTSYLGKELLDKYDIKQVSLSIDFEDVSYKETEISSSEFYKKMKTKGIPKSSQPPIGELVACFHDIATNGDDVVGVFLSSEMSGTYQTALMELRFLQNFLSQCYLLVIPPINEDILLALCH